MATNIKKATRKFFANGKGTATPWGRADCSTQLTRGVVWYTTPGHGGLSVTVAWARDNLTLQAQYLAMFWGGKLWYEEDCKCAMVFHEHPHLWYRLIVGEDPTVDWTASIRSWDPDYFDPDFIARCKAAGDIPDLLFIQPGDQIKVGDNMYRVLNEWTRRGKSAYRIMVHADNRYPTHGGPRYRVSNAEIQGRLQSITREGSVVWTRPCERSWEMKKEIVNG